jgi:hypothetical protein
LAAALCKLVSLLQTRDSCYQSAIFWGIRQATANEEAARMRSVLALSFLSVAVLSSGCLSAPRPQPLVGSAPADKSRDLAVDVSSPSSHVGQSVADTSSSTSLSSRFTKFFSRQDASDRIPLPRNDHPLENGPGGDASQSDIGRDF